MGASTPTQRQKDNWFEFTRLTELPGNPTLLASNYDPSLHAEKYQIAGHLIQSEIQIYQYRRIYHKNIVNVLSFQQKNDLSQCVPLLAACTVVTERVPFRLSMIEYQGVSRDEGFYILKQALNGYQQICKRKREFTCVPTTKSIGIMNDGSVKVWINQNWGKNETISPREARMIDQLVSLIQDSVRRAEQNLGAGFGSQFHHQYNTCEKCFLEIKKLLKVFCPQQNQDAYMRKLALRVKLYAERRAGLRQNSRSLSAVPIKLQPKGQLKITSPPLTPVLFPNYPIPVQSAAVCNTYKQAQYSGIRERGFQADRHNSNYQMTSQKYKQQQQCKIYKIALPLRDSTFPYQTQNGKIPYNSVNYQRCIQSPTSIRKSTDTWGRTNLRGLRTNTAICGRVDSPKRVQLFYNSQLSDRGISQKENTDNCKRLLIHKLGESQKSFRRRDKLSQPVKINYSNRLQRFIDSNVNNVPVQLLKEINFNRISPLFIKKPSSSTVSMMTNPRTVGNTPRDAQYKPSPLTPIHPNSHVLQQELRSFTTSTSYVSKFTPKVFSFQDTDNNKIFINKPNIAGSSLKRRGHEHLTIFIQEQEQRIVSNALIQKIVNRPTQQTSIRTKEQQVDINNRPVSSHSEEILPSSELTLFPRYRAMPDIAPFSSRGTFHQNQQSTQSLSLIPSISENDPQATQRFTNTFKYYLQNYGPDFVLESHTSLNCSEEDKISNTSPFQGDEKSQDEPKCKYPNHQNEMMCVETEEVNVRVQDKKCQLSVIEESSEIQ